MAETNKLILTYFRGRCLFGSLWVMFEWNQANKITVTNNLSYFLRGNKDISWNYSLQVADSWREKAWHAFKEGDLKQHWSIIHNWSTSVSGAPLMLWKLGGLFFCFSIMFYLGLLVLWPQHTFYVGVVLLGVWTCWLLYV